MKPLTQILAVTWLSLLSIPRRLGASLVIVIGVAGVVAVFICVLAMATSFTQAAVGTGRPDRAIVLTRGSDSEASSGFSRENAATILDGPGIRRSPDGKPIVSAENLAFIRLTDRRTGLDAFPTLRGIGPQAFALRPEIRIIAGRMFKPALHEVIVGKSVQQRVEGLEVGSHISLPQGDWTVVGVFASNGDSHESELLTDAETLLSAFQRNFITSVTVMLESPDRFGPFAAALGSDPTLSVDVKREPDYFIAATRPTSRLLKIIAYAIGGIMAFGAAFAALNTMYSAVSARGTEIATLRAIGFGGGSVVASVFVEAMLLALIGAALGAAAAWFFFNGNTVSTVTGTSPSQVTFALNVSAGLIAAGVACACVIGAIGGLFPALRAARLSVAAAMRSS